MKFLKQQKKRTNIYCRPLKVRCDARPSRQTGTARPENDPGEQGIRMHHKMHVLKRTPAAVHTGRPRKLGAALCWRWLISELTKLFLKSLPRDPEFEPLSPRKAV